MTNEEVKEVLELIEEDIDCDGCRYFPDKEHCECEDECLYITALNMANKALEKKPIDKSAMMYEIYMEGVNMTGEYQGCWVRFKDIEKIVDKYMADKESEE